MKKLKKYILIILTSLLFSTSSVSALSYEEAFLTATLFGEAGGEGIIGIQTVASVIMNRRNYYQAHAKNGQTIKLSDICLARYQFSFWNNKRNWNVQSIENWAKKLYGSNAKAWNNCLAIARQAIAGSMKDVTNGATFYYATWMDTKGKAPSWARGRNYKIVGHHKLVYGIGLSALKTWHSSKSIAGGGGGSNWNGAVSGGGSGGSGGGSGGNWNGSGNGGGSGGNNITSRDYDLASDPANEYIMPSECKGAAEANGQIVNNEIMKHRLFAEDILIDLKDMMALIYRSLSILFARGHALMCFATKVSPICLDMGAGISAALKSLVSCTVVVPLLNYFIPGILIYITGFFMCMSIGMYFIDISFKLGFATLLLPLSISLWPFPPTQSKLSENVAIVIYNAMLFAFVSIGTAYAVKLINASLGTDEEFWKVMSVTSSGWGEGLVNVAKQWSDLKSDEYKDSMEKFSEAYDISSVNILVILFALIFGFKILSSSIQDYLQFFFGAGSMGSADTAMHHMGTQAIGKIKQNTVDRAARVGRDITLTAAGKGLESLGNKMANKKFGGAAASANSSRVPSGTNPQNPAATGGNQSNNGATLQNNSNTATSSVQAPDSTNQQAPASASGNQATNSAAQQNNSNANAATSSGQAPGSTNQQAPASAGGNQANNGATPQNSSNANAATSSGQASGSTNQQAPASAGGNQANNSAAQQNNQNTNTAAGNTQPTSSQQNIWQEINNFTRPTSHSLTVGNAFKAIRHPQQAYRTIKQLAQQGTQDWKNAETMQDKGKLVLKKSGQVVMRSIRGSATEAANSGMGLAGGFLQSLGKSMQKKPQEYYDRRMNHRKQQYYSGNDEYNQQLEKEYQEEQDRINNSN